MEKVRYMISDAANIVNVESHVLRYWEDELELNVPRNELGHRYYTKENIQEFQRIKELKEQGYQLKAIRMIVHNMSPDAQAEVGTAHPGIKQDLHQVAYTQDEKAVKAEHQSGQVTRIQDGYAAKQDQHADLNPYTDSGRNMPVSAQHENQSVLDNTDKMAQFTELMTSNSSLPFASYPATLQGKTPCPMTTRCRNLSPVLRTPVCPIIVAAFCGKSLEVVQAQHS